MYIFQISKIIKSPDLLGMPGEGLTGVSVHLVDMDDSGISWRFSGKGIYH
jgi:hypothetical protein